MKRLFLLAFVCVIFLACQLQVKSQNSEKDNNEPKFVKEADVYIVRNDGEKLHFDAQIADTEEKSAMGLMYRTHMEDHQSMLFLFEYERPLSFWMKNTYISLDIIFINSEMKIVSIARNTEPLSEQMIPSNVPALYALEIKAGLSDKMNINIGDHLQYQILKQNEEAK